MKLSFLLPKYLCVFFFLFVLNPYLKIFEYTVPIGVLITFFVFCFHFPHFKKATIQKNIFIFCVTLVFFGIWPIIVSAFLGSGLDFAFLKLNFSVVLYLLIGFLFGHLLNKYFLRERVFYIVLNAIVIVAFLNSIIVVSEYFSSSFKNAVEFLLAQATNVDYRSHEFKLRGLASGGGAGLSVFHAIGAIIALYLFQIGNYSWIKFLTTFMLIVSSILFIGRTGFLIVFLGGGIVLLYCNLATVSISRFSKSMLVVPIVIVIILLMPTFLPQILSKYVFDYAIGFFYGGLQSISEEGTIKVILSSYVLSDEINDLLLGVGNYSGSFDLSMKSDPGYMKSISALGIPLSLLHYGLLVSIIVSSPKTKGEKFVTYLSLILILIAEVKEPFLIQGYVARFLFFFVGLQVAYNISCKKIKLLRKSAFLDNPIVIGAPQR